MSQIIVPPPVPINNIDATWPGFSSGIVAGGAFLQTGDGRWAGVPNTYALMDAPAGGGTSTMGTMHGDQLPCGILLNGRSVTLGGFPMFVTLTALAWPAALRLPEQLRVWTVEWMMDFQGGSPTEASGVQFIASGATVGGWVTAAANTGAFGIVGDGAGGLNFFVKKGAGTYLTTALVLPNVLTECVKYQVQIVAADGRGAAGLTLLINDVVVALATTRSSWTGATALPVYAESSVANGNKFVPAFMGNDGAGISLRFGALRCTAGKFLLNGSERV